MAKWGQFSRILHIRQAYGFLTIQLVKQTHYTDILVSVGQV